MLGGLASTGEDQGRMNLANGDLRDETETEPGVMTKHIVPLAAPLFDAAADYCRRRAEATR